MTDFCQNLSFFVLLVSTWAFALALLFPGPNAQIAMPFIGVGLAIGVTGVVWWATGEEWESNKKQDSI